MRTFLMALAAALLTFFAAGSADAQRARQQSSGMDWDTGQFRAESYPQTRSYRGDRRGTRSARSARRGSGGDSGFGLASLSGGGFNAGPRPRKWCGWWMRTQLGGGAHLNLAWNWRHYGSAASPQVGAVVVWRGHVGMIVGEASGGKWLVKSGNWGGRVATVARSIRGAIVRI